MQNTYKTHASSPTKTVVAREENEQLFIIQGTTIIEANSSDIDFPSQNPTAITNWKTSDQSQILLTRNQRVNVKGEFTWRVATERSKEKKRRNWTCQGRLCD